MHPGSRLSDSHQEARRRVQSHGVLHLDRDRTCLDRQGGGDAECGYRYR